MSHYEIYEVLKVLQGDAYNAVYEFNQGLFSEYITEEELIDILGVEHAEYVFNRCEAY